MYGVPWLVNILAWGYAVYGGREKPYCRVLPDSGEQVDSSDFYTTVVGRATALLLHHNGEPGYSPAFTLHWFAGRRPVHKCGGQGDGPAFTPQSRRVTALSFTTNAGQGDRPIIWLQVVGRAMALL